MPSGPASSGAGTPRPNGTTPKAPGAALRWRLGFALVALAACAVALLILSRPDHEPSSSPPLRAGELSAEALVASIGVVVHFNYVDTAYAHQAEVVARLRELGVRHVRDAMPSPIEPLGAGLRAGRRAGIRATLATGDVERDPASAVADSVQVMGDAIDAFEGPNELDNSGDPGWPATLRTYMPALATAVRRQAPGVPVIGPSFVDSTNRRRLPADLPGLFNGHPYPGGGPPETVIGDAAREYSHEPRQRGMVFTETGYHNALGDSEDQPPVSEAAAAVYFPRLLVTAFGVGARRTFIYELLDEKPDPDLGDLQQHFGLLRNDFSPKPAFSAIKALIAALKASPGEGERERLRPNLEVDGDDQVERLTFVRRDGSRVIALWRPVSVWDPVERQAIDPGRLSVELAFGRRARDIIVWRPSVSATPVLRRSATNRLRLALGGDLVLVSLR